MATTESKHTDRWRRQVRRRGRIAVDEHKESPDDVVVHFTKGPLRPDDEHPPCATLSNGVKVYCYVEIPCSRAHEWGLVGTEDGYIAGFACGELTESYDTEWANNVIRMLENTDPDKVIKVQHSIFEAFCLEHGKP